MATTGVALLLENAVLTYGHWRNTVLPNLRLILIILQYYGNYLVDYLWRPGWLDRLNDHEN